jgi:TolA-binding protein
LQIKPENRFWIYIYGFTAFIMLVAASVFGWLAWSSKQEPGVGRVAGAVRSSVPSSSLADEDYERLSAFQAPDFTPEPYPSKPFQAAIELYRNQQFKDAAAELRALADAHPDDIPARFYLGISLLLSGDRIGGIQELRAVTESAYSPYLERARFYLAKALIGEHDLRRAQQELGSVIAQHGSLEKQAAMLLAEIRPS